jgi:hypothetical protein
MSLARGLRGRDISTSRRTAYRCPKRRIFSRRSGTTETPSPWSASASIAFRLSHLHRSVSADAAVEEPLLICWPAQVRRLNQMNGCAEISLRLLWHVRGRGPTSGPSATRRRSHLLQRQVRPG